MEQIIGLIILGILILCVFVSGSAIMFLGIKNHSGTCSPDTVRMCPVCEQPDDKCYCNCC